MMPNQKLRAAELQSGARYSVSEPDQRFPLDFGNPAEEYAAARDAAALFDFSDRNLIEITGNDRVRFLHSFCTNDVKRLDVGQGCEAFFTNVKGRVLGHAWIDVGASAIWLDAVGGSAERLVPHLERYIINEDVTITDRSHDCGELFVMGPDAVARLANLEIDAAPLADLHHTWQEPHGMRIRIRRLDVAGRRGYALALDRERLAELWVRLCDVRVRPAGSDVWTAIRIEAGLPNYGVDLTDDNLAQEANRTQTAISFTKGCYLGQEPVARLDAMGHVNRELLGLRLSGQSIPPAGARVFLDAAAAQPVGTVTSSAFSFGSESPVAMALLRSAASRPGIEVFVETSAGPVAATVFRTPSN